MAMLSVRVHLLLILFFGYLQARADQYTPFRKNGKYGLKNTSSGEIVITPQFESIGWSDGSFRIVDNTIGAKQNERWALINLDGSRISSHLFTDLIPYTDNLFVAGKRSSDGSILVDYGVINTKGKTVIEHIYAKLEPVENLLIASKRTLNSYRYGILEKNEKVVIPVTYKSVTPIDQQFFSVENDSSFKAVYQKEGRQITGFDYESVEVFDEQFFLVRFYNRQGLIDRAGKTIISPIYKNIQFSGDKIRALPFNKWDFYKEDRFQTSFYFDELRFVSPDTFSIVSGENTGLINEKGEYIKYLTNQRLSNTLYSTTVIQSPKTGYHGALDSKGQTILPMHYDSIIGFGQSLFAQIKKADGQDWSVFDLNGEKLNLFDYERFESPRDGIIRAMRNGKMGLLDLSGKEVSPFLYDSISDFKNGLAVVKYQGQQGVINTKGFWVVTPYRDSIVIHDNFILSRQGSEFKIMDFSAQELIRSYEPIYPLPQGYYQPKNEGLALFNLSGERLLEPVYDSIVAINSDLYWLNRDNRSFFYRPSDRADFELDNDIEEIGVFDNGFIPVLKDGQWGYIDGEGGLKIANRYQAVDRFSEGLSAVKLIGKWGYVDIEENIVLQPIYETASPFINGLAVIQKEAGYGLIDKAGKTILTEKYSDIHRFEEYIILEKDGMFGLADKRGKLIRDPQYDRIIALGNDYFQIEKKGLKGVINLKGVDVVPMAYSKIRHLMGQFMGLETSNWILIDLNKKGR